MKILARLILDKIKEIYSSAFLIGSLLWILLHLIWIKQRGRVVIAEDNKWILNLEIVLMSLLTLLGIERFVKDVRR
jgi:hypothetical protein